MDSLYLQVSSMEEDLANDKDALGWFNLSRDVHSSDNLSTEIPSTPMPSEIPSTPFSG
jgi:hypothetical protein